MKIVIIDYGAGNTKSVQFAFERLNLKTNLTADLDEIKNSDGVVFPGVGHASSAMESLRKKGLDKVIPELKQPVLGICLGMQLMCRQSEEGNTKGLGIFEADVIKFQTNLKVPQTGWNQIEFVKESQLFSQINKEFMYFVHSYYVPKVDETIMSTDYGLTFSSALEKNNFFGCQFHPEKSSDKGEEILKNFIKICESYQQ